MLLPLVVVTVLAFGGSGVASQESSTDAAAAAAVEAAAAAADRATIRTLSEASNAFAADFYRVLRSREQGNFVTSPFSVSVILTLACLGSRGNTEQQLASALHLPQDKERLASRYTAFLDSFQGSEGVILRTANKMYVQQGFSVKPSFRDLATNGFRSAAEEVNFSTQNEATRLAINQWVEQNTEGKIKNLFPEGQLSTDAVLVLVNAIYFKGEWMEAFREENTANDTFHVSENSQLTVPMMTGVFQAGYGRLQGLNASVLALNYKGGATRMLIFLPESIEGLSHLEENIPHINFTALPLFPGDVQVTMPKFKIETKLSLREDLEQLGVRDLFSVNANLSGITDQSNVQVSKVLHKAYIEVNEKGAEAAAATGLETFVRSGRRYVLFKADHPFLYAIQGGDNTILFMGRFSQPGNN